MDGRMLAATASRTIGILGLGLVLSLFAPTAGTGGEMATSGHGPLDGKTFAVDAGEKGRGFSDKDTLLFRDGRFHSMGCDKYGFGDGVYTATEKDGTVFFAVETTSPSKGKIDWRGTVRGDSIEVSYTWLDAPHWYKSNPKPVEKRARGGLMKP